VTSFPNRSAARSASLSSRKSPPVTVHLRKMYVDCRYGQLHMHTAFPSNGGFDELTPLVCLHRVRCRARVPRAACELGQQRSVYAPDLPGLRRIGRAGVAADGRDYAAAVVTCSTRCA